MSGPSEQLNVFGDIEHNKKEHCVINYIGQ